MSFAELSKLTSQRDRLLVKIDIHRNELKLKLMDLDELNSKIDKIESKKVQRSNEVEE